MNVLVTGGASGLGEAITRRILQDQQSVVYFTFCRSEERAKNLTRDFKNAIAIKCDFKSKPEVMALREKIGEFNIEVLINNAYTGGFIDSHFHKTASADFSRNFEENIIPTILITQAAIDHFRKMKNGRIITILTAALAGAPPSGSAVYVSGKAYLQELTKLWAIENAKFNITSNAVSPSFMETELTKSVDERVVEQIRENQPSRKLLTTQDVAESVFYLATTSQQKNGQNIMMNSAADIIR